MTPSAAAPPPSFASVAIIGAGTMGHALALVHAIAGCDVRMQDVSADRLAQAPGLIAAALDTLIEAGSLPASARAGIVARIISTDDLATAVNGADLVVEAVVEDRDVKREVFAAIDAAAADHAVIASNTSHLDPFPLIPARRQAKAAITHWYTPPYIVDLVDLAPGPTTEAGLVERLRAFYAGMGKRPVVFAEMVSGYIANRLQAALNLEIYRLLDDGMATPEAIDDSIRYGLALRLALLGQLMKNDYTGLDMSRRALANRTYTPPEPTGTCAALEAHVAAGRLGVMSGAGFFDYGDTKPADLLRQRDINLLRLKQVQAEIDAATPRPVPSPRS